MNLELDKQLVDKYPNLYRLRHNSMKKTLMCWGFECEAGWYNIIDELSAQLEAEILKQPEDERSMYAADQVKEKYGTLRFYMTCETEEMSRLIETAEKKSEITCEVCGADGIMRCRNGWFYTACEDHT